MATFGLIGKTLEHSFSRTYFSKKFEIENLPHEYLNFELDLIEDFESILLSHHDIKGISVTIPFKKEALVLCHKLTPDAKKIGAVNCLQFIGDEIIGHNTDWWGFTKSLVEFIPKSIEFNALILGTGGASKAVGFALNQLSIPYKKVSSSNLGDFSYNELGESQMHDFNLIINTTPLGTFPNIEKKPDIPYEYLTEANYLFDLVYNPDKTAFMKAGLQQNCQVKNGYEMLVNQANESWEIWNQN